MHQVPSALDPLAGYLERDSHLVLADIDDWTPELRVAAERYLVHRIDSVAFDALLGELNNKVPNGTRLYQSALIVGSHQLWDVLRASHRAAVKTMPNLWDLTASLEELIQALSLSESDPDYRLYIRAAYGDVSYWLYVHASYRQRAALLHYFKPGHPVQPRRSDWWYLDFGDWLQKNAISLEAVVKAWTDIDRATAPARSVRIWAKERGFQVPDHGRIAAKLVKMYLAEQKND